MALTQLTKIDGGGISTTSDYRVGVITASKFVGPFDGTAGNFSGIITASGANFSGNVTIGGTLTYEDVTNIDSVGIITARDSIDCNGDLDVDGHTNLDNVSVAGVSTFSGNINLPDSVTAVFGTDDDGLIKHTGSNLQIQETTGNIQIVNYANDKDVVISTDDGSGGTTNYFTADGSTGKANLYHYGDLKLATSAKGITVGTGVTVETNGNSNFVGVSSLGTGDTGAVYLYNPDADALSATTNDIYGWKAKTYTQGLQVNSTIYLSRSGSNGLGLAYNNATGSYITAESGFLRLGVPYGGYLNLYSNNVYIKDRLEAKTYAHFQKVSGTEYKVNLYGGNNVVKLTTEESGVNIVGTTTSTQLAVTGVSTFTGNIVPSSDSATDIGTNSVRFANIYADTLYGDGSNLTGITQTTINSNADNRVITGSGTANTLNAESTLTYDSSILNVISTTQGLGLNLRNTSNEYTRIIFDAARTGAASALGILEGKWNNGNSVCQIYLQSGDDTTNKDDGRISMVVNSAAGSNKTAFRIEPDASVQLPNDLQKLQFGQHQGLSIWHGGSNGYIDNETGNLTFRTTSSNAEALRITSDGIIETGTAVGASGADGDQRLRVGRDSNCNIAVRATGSTTASTGLDFGDSADDRAGRIQYMHNGDYMSFHTNGAGSGADNERLRIRSDGNIGIGNNVADANWKLKLVVPDNASYQNAFNVTNNSNSDFNINIKTNLTAIGNGTNKPLAIFTNGHANPRIQITEGGSVNVGGDFTQSTYTMKVTGSFAATTKSFVIDHPTKENHQLRYACLEGPENSVYVRGKTSDSVIELPDYWKGLVHDDSITVNVTPIGNHKVWVESINNNSVTIGSDGSEYFYTVFAERKDVDKLEVEVAK